MICYRDMTFCLASDCAKFEQCKRALTAHVASDADTKGELISMVEKLDCYEPRTSQVQPK